jgi:phenylacetate-CoA ligase
MNKNILKSIRDNLPDPIKILFSNIFRNKLVKNKTFLSTYNSLLKKDEKSESEIKEYQFNSLKKILCHAYENVPYYQKLFKDINFDPYKFSEFEEIKSIPYLTRDLIKENFNELISSIPDKNGYYTARTGGSTGEPLKIMLDYNSIFSENAFVYINRKNLGYNFKDKVAAFRGIEFGSRMWKYNPMHNELVFSPFKLSQKTLGQYLNKMNSYHPVYLNGYLSSIYYFAKLMDQNKFELKYHLKGIFLISENIDPEKRSFVENFFNTKSMTFYGHSERVVFAEERGPSQYVFNPYYGYTELLRIDEENYEICGTGFLNNTMPLIRYKTQDICKTSDGYVNIIGGRNTNEYLTGISGEIFSHAAINFHSDIFKNVIQYQFIQKEKGKTDLQLLVNDKFMKSEIETMKNEIDKKTKGVLEIRIKVVDRLILSERGKFKLIINNVGNNI